MTSEHSRGRPSAGRELGDESTRIVVDGAEMVIERTFDAPRELVWAALTSAEHVENWWGPHGTHARVEMDLRPGGRWRITSGEGAAGVAFTGEFIEVEEPERLVRTSSPDIPELPGGSEPAVETITLEDLGGRTRMVHHSRFPSEPVLGFAIEQGMTKGILEQHDRLADLLPGIG